jgi:hypothetical protein
MRAFPRRFSPRFGAHSLLGVLGVLASAACGDATEYPDRAPVAVALEESSSEQTAEETDAEETDTESSSRTENLGCRAGATVACRVPLPSQGGVENCFVGVRTCVEGTWSACHDPARPPNPDDF